MKALFWRGSENYSQKVSCTPVIISTLLMLSGCAGRAPAPVSVVQPQDRYLDCKAILAEVETNN